MKINKIAPVILLTLLFSACDWSLPEEEAKPTKEDFFGTWYHSNAQQWQSISFSETRLRIVPGENPAFPLIWEWEIDSWELFDNYFYNSIIDDDFPYGVRINVPRLADFGFRTKLEFAISPDRLRLAGNGGVNDRHSIDRRHGGLWRRGLPTIIIDLPLIHSHRREDADFDVEITVDGEYVENNGEPFFLEVGESKRFDIKFSDDSSLFRNLMFAEPPLYLFDPNRLRRVQFGRQNAQFFEAYFTHDNALIIKRIASSSEIHGDGKIQFIIPFRWNMQINGSDEGIKFRVASTPFVEETTRRDLFIMNFTASRPAGGN